MNKFAKVICMIAVVALAFTSCKKQENSAKPLLKNVTTEQLVNVCDEEEGGKAYMNPSNYTISFEEGDQFELVAFGPSTGTMQHGHQTYTYNYYSDYGQYGWDVTGGLIWPGEYIGGTSIGVNDFYAFYPANKISDITEADGHCRASFLLDAEQTYVPGQVKNLYMAARDNTNKNVGDINLAFENLCGVLCVNLYSNTDITVKEITVTDHAVNIVGKVSCWIDQIQNNSTNPSLRYFVNNYDGNETALYEYLHNTLGYMMESGKRTVKLNCGTGVVLSKNQASPTKFYIVMRPLALTKGMTVHVDYEDADGPGEWEISSDRDNRILPNVVKDMVPRCI